MSFPHQINRWRKPPRSDLISNAGKADLFRPLLLEDRARLCRLHSQVFRNHPVAPVVRLSMALHGAPADRPMGAILPTPSPSSISPGAGTSAGSDDAEGQLATNPTSLTPSPSDLHSDAPLGAEHDRCQSQHPSKDSQHASLASTSTSPSTTTSTTTEGTQTIESSRSWLRHGDQSRPAATAIPTGGGGGHESPPGDPPYAVVMHELFGWPRPRLLRHRPAFLEDYPVPGGKLFNINSFLGRKDPLGGQYFVPPERYQDFLMAYLRALNSGYQLFITENYQQQVYKYFVELDWDWTADLSVVMEVTPKLIDLVTRVVSEFYRYPYPNTITSIRTPYKVHLNFPQVLTTELLACMCRDRILAACREHLGVYDVDWERLVDFPHGSLRLMGSRKAFHIDSDPAWVLDKAYHPARLVDGKWRPGGITVGLLAAASIFPGRRQVEAFERSPAYLDVVFGDLDAYKQKIEERRRRRAERLSASEQQGTAAAGGRGEAANGRGRPEVSLPPGSRLKPLRVTLEVRGDETVALNLYIKSRFRKRGQRAFYNSHGAEAAPQRLPEGTEGAAAPAPTPTEQPPPLPGPSDGTLTPEAPTTATVTTAADGTAAAVAAALAAATAAVTSASAAAAPQADGPPAAAGPETTILTGPSGNTTGPGPLESEAATAAPPGIGTSDLSSSTGVQGQGARKL